MEMNSDTYYVVGVHGPPTKETAPHGYRWRAVRTDGTKTEWAPWDVTSRYWVRSFVDSTEWAPLTAPPVEQAPAPEPVARWYASEWAGTNWMVSTSQGRSYLTEPEAIAAKNALNTLDRDGVCYGPGRPMSELPPKGAVLCKLNGDWCVAHVNVARYHRERVSCWWPLPESGE